MTPLPTLLRRQSALQREQAEVEAQIKVAERAYWSERGYLVVPRREHLVRELGL